MGKLFESLDFLYVPAPDIEAAIGYYAGVGSKLLWKIDAFGVWLACIRVSKFRAVVASCRPSDFNSNLHIFFFLSPIMFDMF